MYCIAHPISFSAQIILHASATILVAVDSVYTTYSLLLNSLLALGDRASLLVIGTQMWLAWEGVEREKETII